MLSYILPFIILILIVVFIHEYGHYYFAKYGVGVTDFSIGFGQEILDGTINLAQGGKYAGFLWWRVKFFGEEMFFSSDQEKIIKNTTRREKIICFKTFISKSFDCIWRSFS